jgi:Zn-dependent oligopeptidase
VDAVGVYHQLFQKVQGLKPIPGDKFPASFGHLMGGYDAGYYGYLWSDVFAQDMFTRFEKAGLTNPAVGTRYRKIILENGNMVPAMKLLTEFLGRKPNSKAFFRELGIKN